MNPLFKSSHLLNAALCVVLAGCAGVQPARYSSIESSPYLRSDPQDKSGRVPYRYALPADWHTYRKLILDPVAIYRGTDHQFGDLSEGQDDARRVHGRHVREEAEQALRADEHARLARCA